MAFSSAVVSAAGMTIPAAPSSTSSLLPQWSLTTTGSPEAIASIVTSPKASSSEGRSRTSAPRISSAICWWPRLPFQVTLEGR